VHAPPFEGRANAALIEFLAELLDLPRSSIEIASGQAGRNKRIMVQGRDAMEVATAIAIALTQ
jgi:uncharacterized protein YggU (UPF0235/DUF167 family)